jgi:hypothetical protein
MTPAIAPDAPTIRRVRRGDGLRQGRAGAGEQIEHEEPAVAHAVLDVVAEDPQVEHVAGEVHGAAVDEHRGQHRAPREIRRNEAVGLDDALDVRHGQPARTRAR